VKIAAALSGALIAGLAFAAYGCGSSTPAGDSTGGDPDASTSSSGSSGSSGTSGGSSSGGSSGTSSGSSGASSGSPAACAQACQTDQDCQNWCAPVNNGLNCCDSTHVCFQWSGNACPAQTPDAGTTPPYGP
jgi:hypothetical protein